MTAADAREALEAIIWRTRAVDQHAVIGILAAADRYATAVTAEVLDSIERDRRRGTSADIIASRRADIIASDGKRYGRTA
jgi:hypothetical protein